MRSTHMTAPIIALTLLLGACASSSSHRPDGQRVEIPDPTPARLIGTWRVDLRPTPDSAPYYQLFTVTEVRGSKFSGTFYGSPLQNTQINADWGSVHFAFVTEDGRAAYHSAGQLVNDRLEGTTHANGRGFLSVWTATRVAEPDSAEDGAN